jgi:hypothetical protein
MSKKPVKGSIEQLTNQPVTKIMSLKVQKMGRRLMDKNTDLSDNPDRRIKNAERRSLDTANHSSPVRRYTLDRRKNIKDRRTAETTIIVAPR